MPAIKTLNEELLKGIPPGTWVAISEDQQRVVGIGATISRRPFKRQRKMGRKRHLS
jgi:hypothetical protein